MLQKPIAPFIKAESADFFLDIDWAALRFCYLAVRSLTVLLMHTNYIIIGRRIISVVVIASLHNVVYYFGVLLRRAQSCVAGVDVFREIKLECRSI